MEILNKIILGIASIPVVCGLFVFIIGFLPLILLLPFNLSNGLMLILGGLLMAAWFYFLRAKKIINIVLPIIPIPLWTLGIVLVLSGVYQTIFGNFGDAEPSSEVVKESVKPSINTPEKMQSETETEIELAKKVKPSVAVESDQESLREQVKRLEKEQLMGHEKKQEFEQALEKAKQEAKEQAPKVIAQMQESLENIKKLKGTPTGEQYEAIMKSQDPENAMTLDDAIAEMEQTIEDFKHNAYDAE